MRGAPTDFWGKLAQDSDGSAKEWHPLEAHCADVAACCEALLLHTQLGVRLAHLLGRHQLGEVTVARLVVLAALHDLGKYAISFQNRAFPERLMQGGHVEPIVLALSSSGATASNILSLLAPLDAFGDGWGNYLAASISHHGRPEKIGQSGTSTGFDPAWFQRAHGLDSIAGMTRLFRLVQRWCPQAFASGAADLSDVPPAEHFFAGIVMLADWLGSDRSVFSFADAPVEVLDPMPLARERAAQLVRERFLSVDALRPACRADFDVFSRPGQAFVPRPAQICVDALDLPEPTGASLTILEAETGSGKTEAAMHRFAQLFRAGTVDGLYFALPTRTSATQIHRRVVDAVSSTFADLPETDRPPVVLAVPGYLRVDELEGRALPDFQFLWPDDDRPRTRHRTWAAENSKRFLAGSVVIGTIDQVLLSTLTVSHAHLRATALSRLLLVVDEVHASDAYMATLLDRVLAFHFQCGGHALLMSATLGTSATHRYFARLALADLEAPMPRQVPSPLEQACVQAYPAVHHAVRGSEPRSFAVGAPGNPKHCVVELSADIDRPDAVATRALAAARLGAQVLVLRNTVRDAVDTQRALEGVATAADEHLLFRVKGQVTLHHARFAEDDRRLLDEAIETRLGKNAARPHGSVTVATQTVQQSLDLDADLLITDLCPMDVLLQRIGRLHRHARPFDERPQGFRDARCIVLDPGPLDALLDTRGKARGSHGFGTVYDDLRILEATRRVVAELGAFETPRDNRMLVERTTHPEALAVIVASSAAPMAEHERTAIANVIVQRQLAGGHAIVRSTPIGEYGFPPREQSGRIATRLGEEDRLIELEPSARSPFGTSVRRLKIPHWLTRGWPAEVTTFAHSEASTLRLTVSAAGKELARLVYDRLGLRAGGEDATTASERSADE